MGLDLWFREDVARILASTHEAMAAPTSALPAADAERAAAYRQGYADALRAVGIAFWVAAPRRSGDGQSRPMRMIDVEVQQSHGRSLDGPGW